MKKAKINKKNIIEEKNIVVEEKRIAPELKKLAYIFCGLILFFMLFYGIAYLKVTNKKFVRPVVDASKTIQFDEILLSNLLDQKSQEYYVLVYDDVDDFNRIYKGLINNYIKDEKSLRFYYSDLNNSFNQKYKADENNLNIKLENTSLFKIAGGKIAKQLKTQEEIFDEFKNLNK